MAPAPKPEMRALAAATLAAMFMGISVVGIDPTATGTLGPEAHNGMNSSGVLTTPDVRGPRAREALRSFASSFVENRGQFPDPGVLFVTSGRGLNAAFKASSILIFPDGGSAAPGGGAQAAATLAAGGSAPFVDTNAPLAPVQLSFDGAQAVAPHGEGYRGARTNFLIGEDPSRWVTSAQSYPRLRYQGLYEGVDLVFHQAGGGLKYEFQLAAGVDPSVIRIDVQGSEPLSIDPQGGLSWLTGPFAYRDQRPTSFQDSGPIQCNYVIRSPGSFGFACAKVDSGLPLTIDPLIYSTFLGGGDADYATAVTVDDSGSAYVAGYSRSVDFPSSPTAAGRNLSGSADAFVAKLSPSGDSLEFATYLGGGGFDTATSIVVTAAGDAIVGGQTNSSDFPTTTGAWNASYGAVANGESFVTRLNATGSGLVFSTYLGGTNDGVTGVALGPAESVYIVGTALNQAFPTAPGAFSRTFNGGNLSGGDAFVARLSSDGRALLGSTFLGGGSDDQGAGIAADPKGGAWVVGATSSLDFPTTSSALRNASAGFYDVFISRLDENVSALLYSSYLGGSQDEFAVGVTLDAAGEPMVAAFTASQDLPTTPGAYQRGPGNTGFAGTQDAMIAKLSPDGLALRYLTYFGGPDVERPWGLSADSAGDAIVVGTTGGILFPTTAGAVQSSSGGGATDAFMAKISSAGAVLDYSTLLGGAAVDYALAAAVDREGNAFVVGYTNSVDFPTTQNAFDSQLGYVDAFVSRVAVAVPTLFIYTPAVGTNTTTAAVQVTGVTDPWVNLTVNGLRVDVAAEGSFKVTVGLVPGANLITAVATAPDGRTNTAWTNVTFLDPVPGLNAQLSSLQTQLNATRSSLNATAAMLANASSNLTTQRAAIDALGLELNQSEQSLNSTETELTATLLQLNAARADLDRAQASAGENASALSNASAALNVTQARLSSALEDIAALAAQIHDLRASANSTIAEEQYLESRIAANEGAVRDNASRLNTTDDDLAAARQDMIRAEAEIEGLRALVATIVIVLSAAAAAAAVWLWRRRRLGGPR